MMRLNLINAHAVELYYDNQWHAHDEQMLVRLGVLIPERDVEPVSPPSSPREAGEEDEDGDGWRYYHICYTLDEYEWICYPSRRENARMNKHVRPRKIKQKNKGKEMRRKGRLKQPGGASCNQRR